MYITPMYLQHEKSSAKMVDFHGWTMPLHYGSQLNEHHAVRKKAGLFDVSHMTVIDCIGPEAQAFLSYILANNVHKLKSNQALYSCLLNHDGGVLDDLIAYQIADEQYRLVVNSSTREKNLAWLNQQAENFAVTVTEFDEKAIIALQGPEALAILTDPKITSLSEEVRVSVRQLKPFHCYYDDYSQLFISRTGYTGEQGYELILPEMFGMSLWRELIKLGIQPCGLGARDTLRLEAGYNLYGNDMTEATLPLAANLAWTIDLTDQESQTPREFIGRTAIVNAQANNTNTEQLVGVILKDKGVLRAGLEIYAVIEATIASTEQQIAIGKLTSGGFSPTLEQGIGLARIDLAALRTHGLDVSDHQPSFMVAMRGKLKPIELVQPAFVRNGQSMVKPLVLDLR